MKTVVFIDLITASLIRKLSKPINSDELRALHLRVWSHLEIKPSKGSLGVQLHVLQTQRLHQIKAQKAVLFLHGP